MKTMIPAALLLAGAACSSAPGPGAPAPGGAALAWTRPTSAPLTYEIGDTAVVSMDIMGNAMQVNARSASTVAITLARAAAGLDATITFQSVSGEYSTPMGPALTLGDADKPGPTRMTVDPRGAATVTSRPELSTVALQILGSDSYVQRMFVRLPGRAVEPGARWTDTIPVNEEAAGMVTTGRNVVVSTLRGDTTIAGTRLLVIDSEITSTQQVSGSNQGVEVRQSLTGTSTAVTLWDPALGALVQRTETGVLSGSMELPGMGMSGMPVSIRQSQAMKLRR